MDQQEIKTLKILEAIEEDHNQSQRDLSKRLGISLGLVNSLIKRILKKGYFKVTTIPKNRVKYILTPKGFSEKTTLTYKYLSHAVDFYLDIRNRINQLVEDIATAGHKDIVIYGANELAEISCTVLRGYDLNLLGIVDNERAGEKMAGITIMPSPFILKSSFDAIIVTSSNINCLNADPILQGKIQYNKIYVI